MEQPQAKAPVNAQAEIEVAASAREVWTVIADVDAWPTWNPAIRYAVAEAPLEVGARFRFSTEIGTFKCRLTEVDAPRALSWQGRMLVLGERQTWQLEPQAASTRVSVQAQMTGLGARLLRRRLTLRLQAVMEALVQLVRLEAEARRAESLAESDRGQGSRQGSRDDG